MTEDTVHQQIPIRSNRRTLLKLAVLVEGGLLLVAAFIGALGIPWWTSAKFDITGVASGLASGLALFGAVVVYARSPLPSAARIRDDLRRFTPMFNHVHTKDLVLIAMLAGIGEEAFFRGVLQGGLAALLGVWPALLLASLGFGLAHCISAAYVGFSALVGLLLGLLYIATGNIVAPMLAHGAYDLVALLYFIPRMRSEAPSHG